MANIILKAAGMNKIKVIALYRAITNISLREAKDAVDGLERGCEIVIPMENADQATIDEVVQNFIAVGAYAYVDKFKTNGNSFAQALERTVEETDSKIKGESLTEQNNNLMRSSTSEISVNAGILDREATMAKLVEVGKVAKELQELETLKINIIAQISKHRQEAQEIKEYVPKNGSLWVGPIILMVISLMTLVLFPIAVVVGLVWYWAGAKKYRAKYLSEHQEENEQHAARYIAEYVVPLESQLADADKKVADLHESGKVEQAIDFVGEELFTYACIEDLYNIIKSRKADNLKEALNIYEDTLHKARMEEMQAAIQNASEIAAVESVKQTAYSKEIAKSSHQAATAAKATAYHTREIQKNTRRFR